MRFKIVPLSEAYAAHIRTTKEDLYGHKVVEQCATGYGPCRVSLKPFVPGKDNRLLFSHSPFEIDNAFNQPGPVFIHQELVPAYQNIHRFPPEIAADRVHFPLSLIGYNPRQEMTFTQLVNDKDIDELIVQIFKERTEVEYLHARNAEAGCFICKIERVR
ncbi:MAG: DUF1203 domain-containing protein [Tunicatimonas sp.]